MVSKVYSAALQGLEPGIIEIEAVSNKGLRTFNIVGLADTAIKEAKERVGAAIKTAGLKSPQTQAKRVLVNLAPADLKKEGSLYDLPIALAFLLADEQVTFEPTDKMFLGELALNGQLKPIKGAFSFALLAQEKGFNQIVLPQGNIKEAALAKLLKNKPGFEIIGAETLKQALEFLTNQTNINPFSISPEDLRQDNTFEIDFGWIKGQEHAKRGLGLAAAGGHNIMLEGPPGAGKTLLARSIISILPQLSNQELLELTKIYSACGLLKDSPIIKQRPFRSPHHTSSEPALIGGGAPVRPGEITLAHRGVLFLDEFPEFHRDVLESLRQPLEQGVVNIQRAKCNVSFPARFTLIAAANPCPCGYYNDPEHECTCANSQIASYRRKMSGPLMDRLDIFCTVPAVKYEELIAPCQETETEKARQKIEQARQIQKQRFIFNSGAVLTNSEMQIPQIKEHCQIDSPTQDVLRKAVNSGQLSARGYHRVLKVARTIADLDQRKNIALSDVSEALSYRLRKN